MQMSFDQIHFLSENIEYRIALVFAYDLGKSLDSHGRSVCRFT